MEYWSNISNGEDGLSVRDKLNNLGKQSAPLIGTETLLFKLIGADMNTTDDQAFTRAFDFDRFIVTRAIAGAASGPLAPAAGGIYSEPSKGGQAIVPANQSWGGINSTTRVTFPSLNALTQEHTVDEIYLSLTTPVGAPATCDFFVLGFVRPS